MKTAIAQRPPAALFHLVTDHCSQPFWAAAARRQLVALCCTHCALFRMPPTPFCPTCRSQRHAWMPLSGRGRIYSYTIVTQAILPEMQSVLPYVPALIELEGAAGVRLISNIVGVELQRICVDAPVRVVWDDVAGVIVPRFTLV